MSVQESSNPAVEGSDTICFLGDSITGGLKSIVFSKQANRVYFQGVESAKAMTPSELESINSGIMVDNRKDFMLKCEKIFNCQYDQFFQSFMCGRYFLLINGSNEAVCLYKTENDDVAKELCGIMGLSKRESDALIAAHDQLGLKSCEENLSYYERKVESRGHLRGQFFFMPQIVSVFLAYADLVNKKEIIYRQYQIKKPNGKTRDIVAPHEEIKVPLQDLNKVFQRIFDKTNSSFQVAYKENKSIVDNVDPHKDNDFVFKLDFHHFFQSCKRQLVSDKIKFLFANAPDPERALNRFLDMILIDDALFIGSPISGTLANAIIAKPVAYMRNMCAKCGMAFTVYADDMTMSSYKFIVPDVALKIFQKAFIVCGLESYFTLNMDKVYGCTKDKRHVTGLSINDKNQITCKRSLYESIRQKVYLLSKDRKIEGTIDQLAGQIAYAGNVDKSGKIERLLKKYPDVMTRYNFKMPEAKPSK
jgi:RNA-directed DNA polymerase